MYDEKYFRRVQWNSSFSNKESDSSTVLVGHVEEPINSITQWKMDVGVSKEEFRKLQKLLGYPTAFHVMMKVSLTNSFRRSFLFSEHRDGLDNTFYLHDETYFNVLTGRLNDLSCTSTFKTSDRPVWTS